MCIKLQCRDKVSPSLRFSAIFQSLKNFYFICFLKWNVRHVLASVIIFKVRHLSVNFFFFLQLRFIFINKKSDPKLRFSQKTNNHCLRSQKCHCSKIMCLRTAVEGWQGKYWIVELALDRDRDTIAHTGRPPPSSPLESEKAAIDFILCISSWTCWKKFSDFWVTTSSPAMVEERRREVVVHLDHCR